MRTDDLMYWIKERHSIYTKRQKGLTKPWTSDPILRDFRFCNVYRELDVVTAWIAEYWRAPHDGEQHLWFAMVVARLLNLPMSLAAVGYPVPWHPATFTKACSARKKSGNLFNGAYIVSTNGHAMDKVDYLVQYVLNLMWEKRKEITEEFAKDPSLANLHKTLMRQNGLGSFMAAQVVADLKYTMQWNSAPDWFTFAASGPGSRRGLNRVMEYPTKQSWPEKLWKDKLLVLLAEVEAKRSKAKLPEIHAQDLQNCLCEFDKYERVRLGEGTPKSRYQGR